MSFGREAGAALAFGILYFGMLVYMSFMYATKRYKWASRFTILYFHCLIRVASQACGVAFGVLVWSNTDVFVAYLILSAEGYFSLVSSALGLLPDARQSQHTTSSSTLRQDILASRPWAKTIPNNQREHGRSGHSTSGHSGRSLCPGHSGQRTES